MLNQELNGLSQLQSPEEKIITEVVFCITQKEKHLNIYKYDPNSWKTGILVSCSSVTKKDGCHGVSLCYDVSLWYVFITWVVGSQEAQRASSLKSGPRL